MKFRLSQKTNKFLVLLLVLLFITTPALAFSVEDTVLHQHARMFGKVVYYDDTNKEAVMYGSVFTLNRQWQWEPIQTRTFIRVSSKFATINKKLQENLDKTVVILGEFGHVPGQGEKFQITKLTPNDFVIDTPDWYGFGKTKSADMIYKFDLNCVTDFVTRIKELPAEQPDPTTVQALRDKLNENWDLKGVLVQDANALTNQLHGIGGWQFYEGLIGGNVFVKQSPLIRQNIVDYMDVIQTGGSSPEESGTALVCGYINVKRDTYGNIIAVRLSGDFHETPAGLIETLKDPSKQNTQTWRLEGWTESQASQAEEMEGNLNWVAGSRILVYEEINGEEVLVDQYFLLKDFLTREEFEKKLNHGREFIRGGV